jgi:hypothetical protein
MHHARLNLGTTRKDMEEEEEEEEEGDNFCALFHAGCGTVRRRHFW